MTIYITRYYAFTFSVTYIILYFKNEVNPFETVRCRNTEQKEKKIFLSIKQFVKMN